ncbi:MAG TPA: FG-GAP-like repeat-containing protein, partial [Cyclobacteriaceae bacterium]|nr:FG-GAP-like repeat-containing protein [Cyclobacteriaceae bacterium]
SNGFKRDLTNNDFAKYHAFQQIEEARRQGKQISLLELIEKFKENKIHDYIYKGNDSLGFTNVVDAWGFEEPTLTNGVAYGDLDNDGDLDLVMNELNEVASIYRNNSNVTAANHYVQISLIGTGDNKEGVGAKVTVYAGDKMLVRELFPVRGFQSSVDPVLHFGLGQHNHIDSVVIRWPAGKIQSVQNIPVDKKSVITETHSGRLTESITGKTFFSKEYDVIDFTHHENDFVDFDIQALLPRKYSTMGPALAKGDVNNDGMMDLYVGGAKGQSGELFIQTKEGKFVAKHQHDFEVDKDAEDVDAVFFDADNDKDVDLYVVSGGYEFDQHDRLLQDRLYLNDGHGLFKKAMLPEMLISGSCVRPSDIDKDGDIDLFVGGRIIPGRYPETPESTILINNGKGVFSIATIADELKHIGMVTDAVWVDLNHDKIDDLVVVGEWMGIEIFVNNNGILTNKTEQFLKTDTHGWWNCITKHDFDHDGDDDFIVGNLGLNNIMKASKKKPVTMVFNDFDNNGSVDPILNYYIMGKNYPYPTRDELTDQLSSFKKRFTDYGSYADADLEKVLTKEELSKSKKLRAVQMQSIYLRNDGDHLSVELLPIEMQLAPVFAVEVCDANNDGKSDFIAMGNLSGTRARTGKLTGNTGFLFFGDGKGKFKFVSPQVTGLRCVDDVRKIVIDKQRVIVAINNAPIQCYTIKK